MYNGDVGYNLISLKDWISSRDLCLLYLDDSVSLQ